MTKTCTACGQEASGRFCSHCGASLEGPDRCRECGNELPADGRFCNLCGTPRVDPSSPPAPPLPAASALNQPAAPAPRSSSNLPWAIAAGALVVLLAVILVPRLRDEPAARPPTSGPPITGAPAGAAGVDLASMSPREAADRLFNRVMQSVSSGDTAQAQQFLPMALMAYDQVPGLDLDGHYHIAVLQLVNADPRAAREQADIILAEEPDHLFGLFTAAQAEQAMGNAGAARELYQRFLDRFDSQVDSDRPEYRDHAQVLPAMREEAEAAVN